jgi:hypothetical protein
VGSARALRVLEELLVEHILESLARVPLFEADPDPVLHGGQRDEVARVMRTQHDTLSPVAIPQTRD